MANITRYRTAKGENRYRVRYRKPDGTQTDKRGFRRKIDAETWAAEHVTIAKATGSYIDPEGGKQRIGTLHDQWIAEKKPFWKATSGSNMDSAWKCHCEAKWAERQIGSITHAEVQAWVGSIIDKSGAPSVSRPYQIMQGICSMAAGQAHLLQPVRRHRTAETPQTQGSPHLPDHYQTAGTRQRSVELPEAGRGAPGAHTAIGLLRAEMGRSGRITKTRSRLRRRHTARAPQPRIRQRQMGRGHPEEPRTP